MNNDLENTVNLLRRWAEVEIPDHVWTLPGEDYYLPQDTQEFLSKMDKSEGERE